MDAPMAPNDGELHSDSVQLLIITVNEASLSLPPSVQRKALAVTLAGNEAVCGVVLARQEGLPGGSWDEVLAASGFNQKVLDEFKLGDEGKGNRLCVYTRSADDAKVLDTFITSSLNHEAKQFLDKGGVVATLNCRGIRICLGGFHLDGNLPSLVHRTSQLPAAVLRAHARTGGADVALFAGDLNCTIHPGNSASGGCECGQLVAADIAKLQESDQAKGLQELSSTTRDVLESALASSARRAALLKAMDSHPAVLQVEPTSLQHDSSWCAEKEPQKKMVECGISELFLQQMPPGAFPTYRFTTSGDRGLRAFSQQSGEDDEEMQRLHPHMDVSRECIRECYFADDKAGVLKKRGDMIRLNLGWLDRLYYGVSKVEGVPAVDVHIEQGTPLALRAAGGQTLDHALVPWVVTVKRNKKCSDGSEANRGVGTSGYPE